MGLANKINDSAGIINALGLLSFSGLIWLMIFGNVSGNLGFAVGTQGYNDTQNVINNFTGGTTGFFSYSSTWFQVLAIVLLVSMFVGLLALVYNLTKKSKSNSGFSGY